MSDRDPAVSAAFRRLRRALVARRLRAVDPVLRLELALIGGLVAVFVFWRARPLLDHLGRFQGPAGAAATLTAALALCVLAGGALVAARHLRRLRRAPGGPEWLALPLTTRRLARHLAWDSGLHALWVLPGPVALLAAAAGIVPWWALAALAALTTLGLTAAARAGCALAHALAAAGLPPEARRGGGALAHLLASGRALRGARRPAPRWTAAPLRALLLKDAALTLRHPPARRAAAAWLALALAAVALWLLPLEPAMAGAVSTGLALLAAAALAEWMIALADGDPPSLLGVLPVRTRRLWTGRLVFVAGAALVAAAALGAATRALDPGARVPLVAALALATALVGTLGATYGVTLPGRATTAQRLVALWLGLAVAGSLAFTLAGWLILGGALLHALRRLGAQATFAADPDAEAA